MAFNRRSRPRPYRRRRRRRWPVQLVVASIFLGVLALQNAGIFDFNQLGRDIDRLASSLSSRGTHAEATRIVGYVRVIDGDTLALGDDRIRLFGIDAPESDQLCLDREGVEWPCGSSATRAITELTAGRQVQCDVRDRDQYGRLVAICFAGGEDLNGQMTAQGLAVAYRQYSQRYVPIESAARSAGIGMWEGSFEDPSDWRRR